MSVRLSHYCQYNKSHQITSMGKSANLSFRHQNMFINTNNEKSNEGNFAPPALYPAIHIHTSEGRSCTGWAQTTASVHSLSNEAAVQYLTKASNRVFCCFSSHIEKNELFILHIKPTCSLPCNFRTYKSDHYKDLLFISLNWEAFEHWSSSTALPIITLPPPSSLIVLPKKVYSCLSCYLFVQRSMMR